MTRTAAAAVSLCLLASMGLAQTPPPSAEPTPSPPPGAPGAPPPGTPAVDVELLPDPTGYKYTSAGAGGGVRRDPFVSLLKPVSADQVAKTRKQGMEGFLIQEVALKGIVRTPKGYTAMLLGTDGKSYFVHEGQRLYDGVITRIDAATVTFRQEITDPLSTVKTRDVRKTLYPSEEARQ